MIWWFLAGFIAGAVSLERLITIMGRRIRRQKQMEAFTGRRAEDEDETGYTDENLSGD